MVTPVIAEGLLREVREAAATRNVREAVRDLALHALRSRPLSAAHIATVARTVGEGIESADAPRGDGPREAHRGAWAGLEDAVAQALLAVELTAREFAERRGGLAAADRERLLEEVARLARSLEEGWRRDEDVPFDLKARLDATTVHLRQAAFRGPDPGEPPPSGDACAAFTFVASGVLLGLSQPPRGRAAGVAL